MSRRSCSPWTIQRPPSWLTELDPRASALTWHHVAENDSWYGLPRLPQGMPTRPLFIEGPHVWIVRGGGADHPVLVWEGQGPSRGEQWRKVASDDGLLDANGRYFLTTARLRQPASAGPSWLAAPAP